MNASATNPAHVARHEIIHALRDKGLWGKDYGLFSQAEWQALVREARANASIRETVEQAYPDLTAAAQSEEMVAELYADWATTRAETPPGPLGRAFERIHSLFRAMASALRGEGFIDAANIMRGIANGRMGSRGHDQSGHAPRISTEQHQRGDADTSEAGRFAADFMAQLAGVDELFAYPRARSVNLRRAMAEVDPMVSYIGDTARSDEAEVSGAERRYLLRSAKGTDVYVFETVDSVWIDVSRLGEGEAGSRIYAAVADYAANSGLTFIGDPAGLSDIALRRRTDAMLSSALKQGSTSHLALHQRQIDVDKSLGVPPLTWAEGDHLGNMASLIKVRPSVPLSEMERAGIAPRATGQPVGGLHAETTLNLIRSGIGLGRSHQARRINSTSRQHGIEGLAGRVSFDRIGENVPELGKAKIRI